MILRRSLRLRVAAGIALLAVAIVGLQSALLLSAFETLEDELVDAIVVEELQKYIVHVRNDPGRTPRVPDRMSAFVAKDAASRLALPRHLRELTAGLHDVHIDGREHHAAVRDEPEGRFVLLYDVSHHDAREGRFVSLLLGSIAAALCAAAVLGYWSAGRLVRPVYELARRVEALGAGRPGTPLAKEFVDEEVRRLAMAFDGYLQKVAEFIQREQEFTANVSHELRTPLTSIRTSCELLLEEPGLGVDTRRRVEAIGRAAMRLTAAADSLLYLARGGEAPRLEEVSVRDCVEEAAEPVRDLLARKGVALNVTIHPAAVLRTDWHALYLVASNLLRNAALYTDRGGVRIDYHDGGLTFEDSGAGMDAAELPRVLERYYRGDSSAEQGGSGLGLAIVKRICESFGWRLEISSARGQGTRVTVRFPAPA